MMRDAEEDTFLFEPLLISEGPHREHLNDLALELATRNAGFRHSLPAPVVRALAGLVRSMNCYYSNLIEGHNTHPVDIERALEDDYSADPEKRDLQLEAKAHIKVQQWIDDGGLEAPATDPEMIRAIHRRFCEQLPEELLIVKNPKRLYPDSSGNVMSKWASTWQSVRLECLDFYPKCMKPIVAPARLAPSCPPHAPTIGCYGSTPFSMAMAALPG